MDLYDFGGFQVGTVLMDNEFEYLRNLVPYIIVNMTTANKRHIRLIKERGRGHFVIHTKEGDIIV